MPESLGEAVLDLRADDRGFSRVVDSAEKKVRGLDATFKRIGKSVSGFGDKMSTRVTLPLIAVGAAAFKMAADAEESSNKFEVVMGRSADAVRAKLKELESTIPLTTGEFLGLAAGVQDLLVPMGLSREAGAKMSAAFVKLSGDIAAFNDVSPAQVLADIKSGLIGSSEPLFKYGVDTRVAALEATALAAGLIEQGEALTDTTRAQAVMLQIQQQSTDAMGAAAREAEGASASTRFLFRDLKQLAETIGQALLPILTPMIQGFSEWVKWFSRLSPETQSLIVKTALLVAAIGPVMSVVGRLTTGVGGLMKVFSLLKGAGGIAGVVTSLGGLSGILTTVVTFLTGPVGIAIAIGALLLTFKPFRDLLVAVGKLLLRMAREGLAKLTAGFKRFLDFISPVTDKIIALGRVVAKWMGEKFEEATVAVDAFLVSGEAMEEGVQRLGSGIKRAAPALPPLVKGIGDLGKRSGSTTIKITKLDKVISALGFVTAASVETEMLNLATAIDANVIPAEQIASKIETLTEKYADLGLLSPKVQAELIAITQQLIEQGVEITTKTLVALGLYEEALKRIQAERMKEWQDGWTGALRDNEGAISDLGEASTEFVAGMADKIPKVTTEFERMFGEIKTGIPLFDDLIAKGLSWIQSLVGGIPIIGDLFGKLFGKGGTIMSFAQQLFGGGSGSIGGIIGSALGGPLGAIAGNFATGLAKKLFGGITSILGGIFGGGPSAEEIAGRNVAQDFRDVMIALLDDVQRAEAGTDTWKLSVIGLRDTFLAFGKTEAEALAFSEALWKAEAEGPEAVAALIAQISPMLGDVQAAMASTGLSLTDLRNLAINRSIELGISVAEAFQQIAAGVLDLASSTTDSVRSMADAAATATDKTTARIQARVEAMGLSSERAAKRIERANLRAATRIQERFSVSSASISSSMKNASIRIEQRVNAMGLSSERAAKRIERSNLRAATRIQERFKVSSVSISSSMRSAATKIEKRVNAMGLSSERAAKRIERANERAAQRIQDRFDEAGKFMEATFTAMARSSVDAADSSGAAWVRSAKDAEDAWDNTRKRTVKTSSILDIERFGTQSATRLGESHVEAASDTGEAWRRESDDIERLMRRLQVIPTVSRNRVDDVTPFQFTAPDNAGRGGGVGSITVNLNLDGEVVARKVVRLTPGILRKLGLQ